MLKRWIWVVLAILFLLLKFVNILNLPLYLDEGLYIFWSKLFSQNAGYAYVSLQDGKTPLFIWLTSFLNPFVKNYLLTARLISLVAGLITLGSWFFIAKKSKYKDEKFILLFLMAITPMCFLIERMGFVDSLLTAFFSLSTLMLVNVKSAIDKLRNLKSFVYSFLGGIFLGLAYLTKTTTTLFAATLLLVSLVWVCFYLKAKKFKEALKLIICSLIGFLVYREILGYLRVGAHRFWGMIANKEVDFVYTPSGLMYQFRHYFNDSLKLYDKNISLDLMYLLAYFSFLIVFAIIGSIHIFKKEKEQIWVVIYLLALLLAMVIFGKVTASRYFYPLAPAVAFLSSVGLSHLLKLSKKIKVVSLTACGFIALQSLLIVFYPQRAILAGDDYSNFFSSGNSAYGLNQAIQRIKLPNDSIVGVTGIWGVGEGASVILEDNGIKSVVIDGKGSFLSPVKGVCPSGTLRLSQGCWKLNIEGIKDSSRTNKYLFITESPPDIKDVEKLYHFNIVDEITHPGSGSKSYLLEI